MVSLKNLKFSHVLIFIDRYNHACLFIYKTQDCTVKIQDSGHVTPEFDKRLTWHLLLKIPIFEASSRISTVF